MSSLVPIHNESPFSIYGLNTAWLSNTTLTITTGYCKDSTNVFDMYVSATKTLNAATTGANALDTGTFAASTEYYIFAIGKSRMGNDLNNVIYADTLMSLSKTAPTLPAGYDIFRRIGTVKSDSSTHFLLFWQTGLYSEKEVVWDEPISVLSGGSSATLAAVDCSAGCMVADNQKVRLQASFTPNAAADTAAIIPANSAATTGTIISGVVAAKAQVLQITTVAQIASSVPKVKYKVTASGALSLSVVSFVDSL